jgi:hypothetical protein
MQVHIMARAMGLTHESRSSGRGRFVTLGKRKGGRRWAGPSSDSSGEGPDRQVDGDYSAAGDGEGEEEGEDEDERGRGRAGEDSSSEAETSSSESSNGSGGDASEYGGGGGGAARRVGDDGLLEEERYLSSESSSSSGLVSRDGRKHPARRGGAPARARRAQARILRRKAVAEGGGGSRKHGADDGGGGWVVDEAGMRFRAVPDPTGDSDTGDSDSGDSDSARDSETSAGPDYSASASESSDPARPTCPASQGRAVDMEPVGPLSQRRPAAPSPHGYDGARGPAAGAEGGADVGPAGRRMHAAGAREHGGGGGGGGGGAQAKSAGKAGGTVGGGGGGAQGADRRVDRRGHTPDGALPLGADNRGFAMLQRMGWQPAAGLGLGARGQGATAPLALEARTDRLGLGAVGTRRDRAQAAGGQKAALHHGDDGDGVEEGGQVRRRKQHGGPDTGGGGWDMAATERRGREPARGNAGRGTRQRAKQGDDGGGTGGKRGAGRAKQTALDFVMQVRAGPGLVKAQVLRNYVVDRVGRVLPGNKWYKGTVPGRGYGTRVRPSFKTTAAPSSLFLSLPSPRHTGP